MEQLISIDNNSIYNIEKTQEQNTCGQDEIGFIISHETRN